MWQGVAWEGGGNDIAHMLKVPSVCWGWSGSKAVAVIQGRDEWNMKTEMYFGARIHRTHRWTGCECGGQDGNGGVLSRFSGSIPGRVVVSFMEVGKLDMGQKSVLEKSRSSVLPTSSGG